MRICPLLEEAMRPLLLLSLALTLPAVDDCADAAAIADKAKLQGTWKGEALTENGQAIDEARLSRARLTIKGDAYTASVNGTVKMTLQLTATTDPKGLDLRVIDGPAQGQTHHCIYRLEADTLTVCRHIDPDHPRPTQFAAPAGSDLHLVVWKRVP
jgi:uncharacterized protein (TIGR03067 family)